MGSIWQEIQQFSYFKIQKMNNSNIGELKFFIAAFYIYIFMEGVLRKWILPGVPGSLLYTVKYLLLIIIAALYVFKRQRGLTGVSSPIISVFSIYGWTVIFSATCITFLINGFVVGSITIIQYLSPIILVSVLPLWINDRNALNTFLKYGAIIAFIVLILAIVQYASPPTAYINKYATEMKNGIAMVGDAARVCSVFSYLTPLGDFCILVVTFTLCLIRSRSKLGKNIKKIAVILFILGALGCFMTGSRSVVIIAGGIILITSIYESLWKMNHKFLLGVIALSAMVTIYYTEFGIEAVDNFIERVNDSSHDVDSRITRTFDITRMFNYAGVFGNGVGIVNMSVQGFLQQRSEVYSEEEIGRIMIEFGFFGFLLITGIRLFVLLYMIRISKTIKDEYLSKISWATTIVIMPMSLYMQMCLYNWFAYIVYFTMLGLNLAINQIDNNESSSILAQETQGGKQY